MTAERPGSAARLAVPRVPALAENPRPRVEGWQDFSVESFATENPVASRPTS